MSTVENQLSLCVLHRTALLIFSLWIFQCSGEYTKCLAQQKLTADNDLLQHPAGISVLRPSAIESDRPITDLTVTPSDSEEYCLQEDESPPVGNYVNITFVHPMLVEKIVSRGLNYTGDTDNGVSYVSNFTILYTSAVNRSMKHYHGSFAPTTYDFTAFKMVPGVYAIRLQFLINSVVSDDTKVYCWHLDIYGCLPEPKPSLSSTQHPTPTQSSMPADSIDLHLPYLIPIPIVSLIVLIIITGIIGITFFMIRKRMAARRSKHDADKSLALSELAQPQVKSNPSYHICQENQRPDILDEDGYVAVDRPLGRYQQSLQHSPSVQYATITSKPTRHQGITSKPTSQQEMAHSAPSYKYTTMLPSQPAQALSIDKLDEKTSQHSKTRHQYVNTSIHYQNQFL